MSEGPEEGRSKHAARGAIERDQLAALVEAGMTIAEIAERVDRSKGTVRHWMLRYGLKSPNGRGPRTEATREAKAAGLLTATFTCRRHGETTFALEGRGYYRCTTCRSESIVRHRRRLKKVLVAEAGGCCCICGYDRYLGALQFHHLNPEDKRLGMAARGVTLSIDSARAEARKCALLCSNCHAEVEAGLAAVPATVRQEHARRVNSP